METILLGDAAEQLQTLDSESIHTCVTSPPYYNLRDYGVPGQIGMVAERQADTPEWTLPPWTKLITGGVDVQENCLYWTIRAWGDYMTSQNIAHGQATSMTKAVQLEIRGAQQTTNSAGDIEFRQIRVVVRGRSAKLSTGKVKAGNPMHRRHRCLHRRNHHPERRGIHQVLPAGKHRHLDRDGHHKQRERVPGGGGDRRPAIQCGPDDHQRRGHHPRPNQSRV